MREVVHIQIGQGGNRIGTSFWETICAEHQINVSTGKYVGSMKDSRDGIEVYFKEGGTIEKYVPRACLLDLEPGVLDSIRSGKTGALFSPDDFVAGKSGAGNNWAKGYYTGGSEILEEALDVIRKQAESCERFQGFQICHSLGGGTGSGLGSLILNKLREEYPERIILTFSVFPSEKVSDTVLEPYSTILALNELIETSDETVILDNEALHNICVDTLQVESPSYLDLNRLICRAMSGVTSSLRFPGVPNADLRKLATNLVPFPRMHFFILGLAPLLPRQFVVYDNYNIAQLLKQGFSNKNTLCAVKPSSGKYLTGSALFRGHFSSQEIEFELAKIIQRNSANFTEWIPNNLMSTVCKKPLVNVQKSVTCIANSTAAKDIFQRILNQHNNMYRSGAYLHWYKQEGMEETEFENAAVNLSDLISEYLLYQETKSGNVDVFGEPEIEFEGDES